jgi:hypothetical protein
MVRNARGVLKLEFDGLLFGLAAEFPCVLGLPGKGNFLNATLRIVHGKRYDNLLASLHIKSLPIFRDFAPLLRLEIIRLPTRVGGDASEPGIETIGTGCRQPAKATLNANMIP